MVALCALTAFAGLLFLHTDAGAGLLRRQAEMMASRALGPEFAVSLGNQNLSARQLPDLGLGFSNVTLRDKKTGEVLAWIADLEFGIDMGSLLKGTIDVERVAVETVRLDPRLSRYFASPTEFSPADVFPLLDGSFSALHDLGVRSLSVDDVAERGDHGGSRFDSGSLTVSAGTTGSYAFTAQARGIGRHLGLSGGATFDSARRRLATMSGAIENIDVGSREGGVDAQANALSARLPTRLSVALVSLPSGRELSLGLSCLITEPSAGDDPAAGTASVSVSLSEGADIFKIAGGIANIGGVSASIEGQAGPRIAATRAYPVTLRTTRLTSSVGQSGSSVSAADLALTARFSPANGALDVDRFRLKASGGQLEGSARLGGLTRRDHLTATIAARDLAAADVLAFWPAFVAPEARGWASSHLSHSGHLTSASFDADLSLSRVAAIVEPDVSPKKDEMTLSAGFSGIAFSTLGELPEARNVGGRLNYRAGKTTIVLERGKFDGFPDVDVRPSSIEFDKVAKGIEASLSLNLSGNAEQLVALADRRPISGLEKLGWKSGEVSGKAKVGVGLAFLLGQDGEDDTELQGWSMVADLEGVDLDRPIEGRSVRDVTGTVSLAPGAVIGTVDATIDGIPAHIGFSQPIEPHPVGSSSLDATISLSAQEVRKALPSIGDFIDGPVSGRLVRNGDEVSATIDLDAARITLDPIGWTKGPGIPATLTFALLADADGFTLKNARLTGEGFSATGTISADRQGVENVVLDTARLNRGDDFSARIARNELGYSVDVTGRGLDARPLLARLRAGTGVGAASQAAAPDAKSARIDARIAVDRLSGFGNEHLADARIDVRSGADKPFTGTLNAATSNAGPVNFSLEREGASTVLRLAADDTGSLLRFAGLYGNMQGGRLRLGLSGPRWDNLSGPLDLRNFTLVDEPRLVSLAGSRRRHGSGLAEAIGRNLATSVVNFGSASVRLAWTGKTLSARDGILRGPVFGSSFEGILYNANGTINITGAFMPAYKINRLFGALPLVGAILGNGDEGGLIGITYQLAGAVSDPTLTINPISAIAPGIFRRIFEY